jgi:predicted N-formylglutamate amidohydrolase
VIVCDHASNRIPRALGTLGLAAADLEDHIAWDLGAGGVARRLAAWFRASAVIAAYSRLVFDLNRAPRDATACPPLSDGRLIPGNLGLTPAVKARRRRALFDPYHAAIEAAIAAATTGERVPACLGIHSFTPRFHGTRRPWHVGVLWDADPRIALPLMARLRAAGFVVGDNEPYSGRHPADYSIDTHAEARGLAHAGIEIRQDLIADAPGQERCARILGDALAPILADRALYRRRS